MVKSILTRLPVTQADSGDVVPTQCQRQYSSPALRQPSTLSPTLPEIFIRSLIAGCPHTPDSEEAELNVVLDMRLYINVIQVSL